jgi:hypothetical protein
LTTEGFKTMDDLPNPAEFLTGLRDQVLAGTTVYGAPDSPTAKAKLADLEAKLQVLERAGDYTPPKPTTLVDQYAQQRLNSEFPSDPATPFNELAQQNIDSRVAALTAAGERDIAEARDAVAKSLGERASEVSIRHSMYDPAKGRLPWGGEIHKALMAEAETAVRAFVSNPTEARRQLNAIGADRQLLELFASKGRAMAAYTARRQQLGI